MRSRRYPSLTEIAEPLGVREEEVAPVLWSAAYFFCILFGYYMMRPVREAAGIERSASDLPWLFAGTAGVMLAVNPLFAAMVARMPRRRFIPMTYLFFIANIAIFGVLFIMLRGTALVTLGWVFYVWLSVFNLFAISVFWQLMVDLWRNHQSKRVFGIVGVGGTLGGLLGGLTVALFAERTEGPSLFLFAAAVFLGLAIVCVRRLIHLLGGERTHAAEPGGGVFTGMYLVFRSKYLLGISAYILGYVSISTALYMLQGQIIASNVQDSDARRAFFAWIDSATNAFALIVQLFLTGYILRWVGVGWALGALPIVSIIGFLVLGIAMLLNPSDSPVAGATILWTFFAFQVLRRGMNYALSKPSRETLFTLVSQEEKYKSKAFIDTFIYRGGDAGAAQVYRVLVESVGIGLAAVAFWTLPVAGLWLMIALLLGRAQQQKLQAQETQTEIDPQQS